MKAKTEVSEIGEIRVNDMNREEKNINSVGGIVFLFWLLSKNKYKCPRCNYPATRNNHQCPNCGQPLVWRKQEK